MSENVFELEKFTAIKDDLGGKEFVFDGKKNFFLPFGPGQVRAFYPLGVTGSYVLEGSFSVQVLESGLKADMLVAVGDVFGVFHAGNGIFIIIKGSVYWNIYTAQKINDFFKTGKVNYKTIVDGEIGYFTDCGFGHD